MRATNLAVLTGQLGRVPREVTGVPVRCPFGHPAVIESAPLFADGSPNPTLLYLTCPSLVKMISERESSGGVRSFRSLIERDASTCRFVALLAERYRARRAALAGAAAKGARLEAGIGGPEMPEQASCLHAYAAALLAAIHGAFATDGDSGPANGSVEQAGVSFEDLAGRLWERLFVPLEEAWCADRHCDRWTSERVSEEEGDS